MVGIGAVIRAGKGIWDIRNLKKQIGDIEVELASDLYDRLKPEDRFQMGEALLEAEMITLMSEVKTEDDIIELQRKRVKIMNDDMQATEEELATKSATKLDIARLAVNMQGMALGFLEDFQEVKKGSEVFENNVKNQISEELDPIGQRFSKLTKVLYLSLTISIVSISVAIFALIR